MVLESVADFGDFAVFPGVGVRTCILEILKNPPAPDQAVRVSAPPSPAQLGESELTMLQEIFRSSQGATIRVGLTSDQLALKAWIDKRSIPLGQLCYCITGVVAHDSKTHESKDRLISPVAKNQWYRPYIEAKEWEGRYGWLSPTRFIEYRPDVPGHMHRPKFPELFSSPKIFIQGISGPTLIATLDRQGVIANHSMLCCVKAEDILHLGNRLNLREEERTALHPDPRYDIRFILGLVCSRLMGFYYSRFLQSTAGVPPDIVGLLPIPKIDFDQAAGDALPPIVEALSASEGDPVEQMTTLGSVPTAQQSRVAHDYICSTVSRIIENNRIVQLERQGFLEWLGVETGFDPREMKGRSELRAYESLSSDALLSILKRNRTRLKVDPSNRSFQERLRAEHAASIDKIRPLKARNDESDRSIDRVVYRLFSLSTEDIGLIEGSR